MQEKLITILTPTYNRANLLPKLYKSLSSQTSNNFKWLIVDDGSIDNTKEVVNSFYNDKFPIEYIYKNNNGKHTAINVGMKIVDTILTFIVDSDDELTVDAVEIITNFYNKYDQENLAGFSFLRKYPDGNINIRTGREYDYIASYNQVRIMENRTGDMAEVYYSKILKQYPFPIFDNEKFLGEDVVWIEIGKKYNLCYVNKAIYISDYLQDGLTKNRRKNNIKNCKGSYYRAKVMLSIKQPIKQRIKTIIQLIVYGKFCGYNYAQIKNNNRLLVALLYVPSMIIYKNWKERYL